jgi:hypothetical protein
MARNTLRPTSANGEGAIPALTASIRAIPCASRRATATVNTGEAADPGENEQVSLFCSLVEIRDAFDKCRTVGEIDIVDLQCDACLDDGIRIVAIDLERTGCVDDDVGRRIPQLADDIAVAIE